MKHTLILLAIIAIAGCSREDITETSQRELRTDIIPAVIALITALIQVLENGENQEVTEKWI